MDFSYMGGNEWGTDQISSATPMNFNNNDIFMTQPKIDKQLQYPVPRHMYPNPRTQAKFALPPPRPQSKGMESFVDQYGNYPQITENMLIILLLVILVVMCSMIYSTVKQTCETIKLMASILASRP